MSKKPARVQFNGGELSPWLYGRVDIAKYDKTARLCRNFIPLAEGSLRRRGGTRFVAETPEDDDVLFQITTIPAEAVVLINGAETKRLYVARGDEVRFEVLAEGYAPKSGRTVVVRDVELEVCLVSLSEKYTITVVANPSDAVVKLNYYERKSCVCRKNEEVVYMVCKDGYATQTGKVVVDEDKTLYITLEAEPEATYDYGDWGVPLAFIACSAYGWYEVQKKCFLFRFSKGYLPVLFDAKKVAPDDDDVDEGLFVFDTHDGYDSYARTAEGDKIAIIKRAGDAIYYYNADGKVISAWDVATMMICGWQLDEDGNYAAIYRTYDGNVSGNVINVYKDTGLVYTLRGRKNG